MKTVVTAVLLVLAATAFADWTRVGPDGGPINCGAVASTTPPTLYAAPPVSGTPLLKSTDGGANWVAAGAAMSGYPSALVVNPASPATLYSVNGSTFSRSTDAGATWTTTSLGSNAYGNDITVNPLNPQVLYIGGYKHDGSYWRLTCFKSTNAGTSWTPITADTAASAFANAVAIDPVDTSVVYLGGYVNTTPLFCKSTDCGATWTEITWPVEPYYIYSIMVSPADHNIVFAGTLYGVYRSTDAGLTWAQASTGNYNYRIVAAPDDPNVMYSAAYSAIYRSTDAGLTWGYSSTGIRGITLRTVFAVPGENGTVYCGTSAGMFKSTDYGLTWNDANHGICGGTVPVVSVNPGQPGAVRIEITDNAIFKSSDDGGTWERQPVVLSCGVVCNIVFDPNAPNRIWMLEGSG